ncbi:MAG TPA: hypothetical protein VFU27_16460 [Terriglobales bacterium]|nr:hypothetical protein [Terriglobales bacterium]
MEKTPPPLPSARSVDEVQLGREAHRKLLLVTVGFAVAAFLVTQLLHYLLVPDLGPYRERIMAEGASAFILGLLVWKLLHNAYRARQRTLARVKVVAELNHHVRNALEVISLSAYITGNEKAIRHIMEGVNRIEWALREILPQESFPLEQAQPPSGSSPPLASSTAPAPGPVLPASHCCSPCKGTSDFAASNDAVRSIR